ncbi:MAG: divergent PAP2 family protein [Alicyclobacillus macrosporangiidus]|uniref:divergent PAP2 family protein n=1 Tax=Alicyclobacillus macrosporangiidus TaxID=392015 RepID=UPI0026EBC376|nr:divergent PAP2 family protein [Alicyclobacillus macrosporangiidus]MCL6601087.1 divergent PAP2 family protein [Alicyclobacillus macrosporangiidus]
MNPPGKFVLASSLLAMFGAQALKVAIHRLRHRRWEWATLLRSGGMPSSHSALMSALTVSLWLVYGWKSAWFAVAFVSSIVVMYDAVGVRRQAGEQAMILEDLIQQMQSAGVPVSDAVPTTLRHWKRQGHTPKEVAAGALLGGVTAVLVFWASSCLT